MNELDNNASTLNPQHGDCMFDGVSPILFREAALANGVGPHALGVSSSKSNSGWSQGMN